MSGLAFHEVVVDFSGGDTTVTWVTCLLSGPERPCAVISCPVDHEDTSRACIEAHGAVALDKCWAVEWVDNSGRECLDMQYLDEVRIPVHVYFDDGVCVENVE